MAAQPQALPQKVIPGIVNFLRILSVLILAAGLAALGSLAGESEDLAPILLAGTQVLVGIATLFALAYMCEALNNIRANTAPPGTTK